MSKFYLGPDADSPLIGEFSGSSYWESPGTIESTSPSLFMTFESDGKDNRQGFEFA
jgi:hypothetical protein